MKNIACYEADSWNSYNRWTERNSPENVILFMRESLGMEWGWQYLFPAHNASVDTATGEIRRHHCLGELYRVRRQAPGAAEEVSVLTTQATLLLGEMLSVLIR
jgi:hypothetical protein